MSGPVPSLPGWIRVPIALYSDRITSGPWLCPAATSTRTGPQLRAIASWYRSGRFSRPSLSTDRLITLNRTDTSRTCSTSSSQREVTQAHGQAGSTQRSTLIVIALRSSTTSMAGRYRSSPRAGLWST